MPFYCDTSALAKLVVREADSVAFREWFEQPAVEPVTSDLARTELMRAARRVDPTLTVQVTAVLDALTLLGVSRRTWTTAGLLAPDILRTLDAVHLASALELEDDLEGFVTYDARLAEAAAAHGIRVVAPVDAATTTEA